MWRKKKEEKKNHTPKSMLLLYGPLLFQAIAFTVKVRPTVYAPGGGRFIESINQNHLNSP